MEENTDTGLIEYLDYLIKSCEHYNAGGITIKWDYLGYRVEVKLTQIT